VAQIEQHAHGDLDAIVVGLATPGHILGRAVLTATEETNAT